MENFINDNLSSREPKSVTEKAFIQLKCLNKWIQNFILGGHEWSRNTNTQIYLNPG